MNSLTIVGRNLQTTDRVPRSDSTWTTLSTYDEHPMRFARVPNLMVWDCHDFKADYTGRVFDIRREKDIRHRLIAKFGYRFSSQFCWMVAYAIDLDYSSISLIGVTLSEEEYANQVSNLSFLLGVAWAKSIGVSVGKPSQVMPFHNYPGDIEF